MAFTSKYELEDMAYSTADKSGIVTANVGKIDNHLHTYGEGTAGEVIAQFEAVYLDGFDSKYDLAQADGTQQPCMGLAIDAAAPDAAFRFQRIGPITNPSWAWATVGGKVYLDPSTPGAITATKPADHAQMVGIILSSTSIFLTGLIHIDDASTAKRGLAALAASNECVAMKDASKVVTPAGLAAVEQAIVCMDNKIICMNNEIVIMKG